MVIPLRPSPLIAGVIGIADAAAQSPDRALASAGSRARQRLGRPLCVALVGRVSAGKSTLLNALLSTAVSPTSDDECTKVVYSFSYGNWSTASFVPRHGGRPRAVAFDGSRLPSQMPMPAAEILRVEVSLNIPILAAFNLVDTPGLASAATANSAVTQRLLVDSDDAAAAADAVLFCLNGPIKDDEAEAVQSFRNGRGASRLTGGTALGLLTKADQLSNDRRTSFKEAVELAQRMSTAHADLFSSVVPVIGLLAETATTGALRERHGHALRQLADAWNTDQTTDALLDARMFVDEAGPVDPAGRNELLELLGLFGIGELLDAIRSGTPANASALSVVARRASGFDAMRERLAVSLGGRADVLKAAAILDDIGQRAWTAQDRAVYTGVQNLLDRPEMFPLRVLEMGQQLAKGRVRPPSGLVEQAWITVQTGLPPATAAEARAAIAAWKEWALLTDSAGRRVAWVMERAWIRARQEHIRR